MGTPCCDVDPPVAKANRNCAKPRSRHAGRQIVRESEGPWRRFLDAVDGTGYKLVITDFDVNERQAPDDILLCDQMVAEYAHAYLDVMLSYPQLRNVLAWGLVDKYSWLTGFDPMSG